MATTLRKTGIDIVGDMPWGTHFCHFYETKDDLLDTLVPYFKAGLDDGEFCVWVVSEPLTESEAWTALGRAVPDLDRHVTDRTIEMFLARDWYLKGGKLDLRRVTAAWNDKLARALSRGYPGMRVSGSTAWFQKKDWQDFFEYEEQINGSIAGLRMTVLCTYPLVASAATELLDVVRTHQFAIAKRQGTWEVVETPQLRQAKTKIERLNRELERRVEARTAQLEAAVDELRKSQARFRLLSEAIPHQIW
ncbi:MAG TPA: MEDS domain-containing protein, partial [Candidatus Binatia bacterium]|nr:MEDS domain-containing protein [Candidatus Binatia bacterium]